MMMMLSLPQMPQIYLTRHKQSNGEQPEQAGGLQGSATSATSVRVLRYERGERREGEWYDPHPTLPARRKPRG